MASLHPFIVRKVRWEWRRESVLPLTMLQPVLTPDETTAPGGEYAPSKRRRHCRSYPILTALRTRSAYMGKGPGDTIGRLRKEFRAAHVKGMAALRSGDYKALDEAIGAERTLIDQHLQWKIPSCLPPRAAERVGRMNECARHSSLTRWCIGSVFGVERSGRPIDESQIRTFFLHYGEVDGTKMNTRRTVYVSSDLCFREAFTE